jgi:hypothetical protein
VGSVFVFAITLNLLIHIPESFSSIDNKYIYDLDEKINGKNYSEWSGQWWTLLQNFTSDNVPSGDTTGEKCSKNQTDPNMFFLFGSNGNSLKAIERECNIPPSKAIFVPVLASECSDSEDKSLDTLQKRRDCVYDGTKDGIVEFKLNGMQLTNLTNYYSEIPINVSLPAGNIWGVDPGLAMEYTGGYYVILKPLPVGQHTIELKGTDPGVFTNSVNYKINILNSTNQSMGG